ncbi:MAG: hypothetical protein M1834_003186 [Cirrosporium novae-zelandiae]|nr:MAG: hypothetical protein M1834_003186 [Cirrosporium novae-zelandiae]
MYHHTPGHRRSRRENSEGENMYGGMPGHRQPRGENPAGYLVRSPGWEFESSASPPPLHHRGRHGHHQDYPSYDTFDNSDSFDDQQFDGVREEGMLHSQRRGRGPQMMGNDPRSGGMSFSEGMDGSNRRTSRRHGHQERGQSPGSMSGHAPHYSLYSQRDGRSRHPMFMTMEHESPYDADSDDNNCPLYGGCSDGECMFAELSGASSEVGPDFDTWAEFSPEDAVRRRRRRQGFEQGGHAGNDDPFAVQMGQPPHFSRHYQRQRRYRCQSSHRLQEPEHISDFLMRM